MRRLFLAAGFSLIFHTFLLYLPMDTQRKRPQFFSPSQPITLTLTQVTPPAPPPSLKEKEKLVTREEKAPLPIKKELIPKRALSPLPKKEMPSHEKVKEDVEVVGKVIEASLDKSPNDIKMDLPDDGEPNRPAFVAEPSTRPSLETTEAKVRSPLSSSAEATPSVPLPSPSPLKETAPSYRNNPFPVYPRLAKERGYEGTVVIEVFVDREGNVREQRLLGSSGYSMLDRAAVEVVKSWVFEPARRGDERIEMWVKVPIRFELK